VINERKSGHPVVEVKRSASASLAR